MPIHIQPFGSINVYNGFAPWNSIIYCIEDDHDEYVAMTEVLDNIADYASDVADVADTVATVSGNTAVAAVAEFTAMVARHVALLATVGSAIVKICNFFDDNDTLGIIQISAKGGDYVEVLSHVEEEYKDTHSTTEDAVYRLYYNLTFVGSIAFERSWRAQCETKYGDQREGSDILCWGNSDDVPVTINLGEKYDYIIGSGVNAYDSESRNCRGRRGCHAEWKGDPKFISNNKEVKGTVHWGVRGCENVYYTPWVTVIKFKCEA